MEMISDFDRPPGTVKTAGYRVNEALEAIKSGPRSQNNQCVVMNDERKLYKSRRSLKEGSLPR